MDEADRLMAQSYQGWVASVLNASRSVQNILPSRLLNPCLGSKGGTDELFLILLFCQSVNMTALIPEEPCAF